MKDINQFIFERGSASTVRFKYCINESKSKARRDNHIYIVKNVN